MILKIVMAEKSLNFGFFGQIFVKQDLFKILWFWLMLKIIQFS